MFTKSKVGSIIEYLIYGIIIGAIVCTWLLPAFGIAGISAYIGGGIGGVLGVVYGFASGEDE